jgi:hypothetical protein
MTDHKFTDDEIIKALEVCTKSKSWGDCEDMGCPAATKHGCYFCLRTAEDYEGVAQDELLKDALALINRQKAEIERLRKYNTDVAFKHYNDGIKEFAERLKSDLGRIPQHQFTRSQVEWSINTFVKEMTEENK